MAARSPVSTGAYPTEAQPEVVFNRDDTVDWSAPTVRFPMAPDPVMRIVTQPVDADGDPVDFTRSSGAFPMFDPPPAATAAPKAKTTKRSAA